jgi:predicted RNA-binding Zn ribbon-like protein
MAIAKDFVFLGRLSLDFAHTGDMGYGSRFERLNSADELNRWLFLSQLRLPPVHISAPDLETARKVRGAIWRVAETVVAGSIPPKQDLALINLTARQPALISQLALDGQSMEWYKPTASAVIATLARDAIMLFGDPSQRARIRRCENTSCRSIFYDDSRPGLRRWCAANRCGDRMRAKAYRRRKLGTT